MSKAYNYNDYNYDQVMDEKHMGRKQYTIRDLITKSGSEVWIESEIWHQEVDEGR